MEEGPNELERLRADLEIIPNVVEKKAKKKPTARLYLGLKHYRAIRSAG